MGFINIHTHRFSNNPGIIEIVNRYPWEPEHPADTFSIGIHPWYIREDRIEEDLGVIRSKLSDDNCLAVGECGLDKRVEVPLTLQQAVFERQLLIAQEFQKPVILHCVAAYQEVMAVTRKLEITVPILVHGFSKNLQVAESLLRNGFYLSFGKYLLRNPELSGVLKSVPNDRFFLETDTVEEGIEAVYEKAAAAKAVSTEKLLEIVQGNFNFVFQK